MFDWLIQGKRACSAFSIQYESHIVFYIIILYIQELGYCKFLIEYLAVKEFVTSVASFLWLTMYIMSQ